VLTIAISTTLLSHLLIFPAIIKVHHNFPEVHRRCMVPFGKVGVTAIAPVGRWLGVPLRRLPVDIPLHMHAGAVATAGD
jgi:hypothetical protein